LTWQDALIDPGQINDFITGEQRSCTGLLAELLDIENFILIQVADQRFIGQQLIDDVDVAAAQIKGIACELSDQASRHLASTL
jgi:hypothetical protein